jgi:hypothetical protein
MLETGTLPTVVLEEGIEPSNPFGYRILSPVRLPISPLQHDDLLRDCCIIRNNCATYRTLLDLMKVRGMNGVATGIRDGDKAVRSYVELVIA